MFICFNVYSNGNYRVCYVVVGFYVKIWYNFIRFGCFVFLYGIRIIGLYIFFVYFIIVLCVDFGNGCLIDGLFFVLLVMNGRLDFNLI